MKKIRSKKEKEKRDRRNKLIIGLVLTVVLFFSSLGFAFFRGSSNSNSNGDGESIRYNNVVFQNSNDRWYFNMEGEEFSINNNPEDLEGIEVDVSKSLEEYREEPVYFSENSSTEGVREISGNLGRYFLRSQEVCLGNCSGELPVKDCSDNVIIVEEGENEVRQEENCIYIESNDLEAVDAFILKMLGIR